MAAGGTVSAATAAATAAVAAGLTTLASQAAVTIINNKGDVGKTLEDLGKADNIKALATAMVTAGVLQQLSVTMGMEKVNAQSTFGLQLQKNLINAAASATVNNAINGGDFGQQLEQSLGNAFIDTAAAQGANKIGDLKVNGDLNEFTHKLAHAIAGCAAGAAKSNECSSGALGAVVGEMAAEMYGGSRTNANNLDVNGLQTETVNFARLMAAVAAATTGKDVNVAAAAGGNATENNYLSHQENSDRLKAAEGCAAGNEESCKERDTLNAWDEQLDAELKLACQGNSNSQECGFATTDMRNQLATYFPSQKSVERIRDVLSKEQLEAGLGDYSTKRELQSYVDLLKVSNQQILGNATPAKLPNTYNSDLYGVMDPKNPNLYMVVKVGDQWNVVGNSDKVYTSVAGVNGILNETNYAPGLMGVHVNAERGSSSASLYTLYYNPTEGFLSDGWETFMDKLGFTTPVTKQFSQVLSDVQNGDKPVSWVAHSQGGAIFSEAVRFNGGDLSKNSVAFHSGANNAIVTNYILDKADINEQFPEQKTKYWNSPWDLVPNIIGLNTLNPIKIFGSIVASPLVIWGSPSLSPHTLPYSPTLPNTSFTQGVTP